MGWKAEGRGWNRINIKKVRIARLKSLSSYLSTPNLHEMCRDPCRCVIFHLDMQRKPYQEEPDRSLCHANGFRMGSEVNILGANRLTIGLWYISHATGASRGMISCLAKGRLPVRVFFFSLYWGFTSCTILQVSLGFTLHIIGANQKAEEGEFFFLVLADCKKNIQRRMTSEIKLAVVLIFTWTFAHTF